MNKKIMTHPELYEESIRLEDLIKEYKINNDYKNLEEVLLKIIPIYEGLNYCDEDEYLEDINNAYNHLLSLYISSNNEEKTDWCLDKLMENYDLLLQRDIGNEELTSEHINEFNEMIDNYKDHLSNMDIFKEYPRLKKFISE